MVQPVNRGRSVRWGGGGVGWWWGWGLGGGWWEGRGGGEGANRVLGRIDVGVRYTRGATSRR